MSVTVIFTPEEVSQCRTLQRAEQDSSEWQPVTVDVPFSQQMIASWRSTRPDSAASPEDIFDCLQVRTFAHSHATCSN